VCVGDDLRTLGVATAVNLDNEPACVTTKIHKITADRRLPAKMAAGKLRFAKVPPQFSFRWRHHASQPTRKRHAPVLLARPPLAARHAPHP
jgi:hypothetical protein